MIAIIDYGLGNVKNVQRAVQYLGYDAILTDKYNEIANADVVILPGVGHFKDAMQAINERGLANIITSITDKPVIGICLGMQLFYHWSAEGDVKGLNIFPGNIIPISKHPLLLHDVYFVHAYQAEMSQHVVAYTEYGTKIPAIVQYQNYIGIQFHPEKSGDDGLAILNQALKGGFQDDQTMAGN